MKKIFILTMLMCGCSSIPEIAKSVEDIANDDVINLIVSKEAFKDTSDVSVVISIKHKD